MRASTRMKASDLLLAELRAIRRGRRSSAHQRRDRAVELLGVARASWPSIHGPATTITTRDADDLRDEGERLLLDLRDGLEDRDEQADDQADEQQRQRRP